MGKLMDKRRRKLLRVILICALIIGTYSLWLPLPARFLVVKDNIKKADAIVILSGDWELGRENKGAELYKEGYAGKIIRILERENRGIALLSKLLNSNLTQEEIYGRYFGEAGVPKDALILGDEVATSTFDEIKAAREIILKNNFKSIILVTSDYHMRRALMTAKWLLTPRHISIYNATRYSDDFHPARWWLHEDDIRGVIMEYFSGFFYLTYHFMLGK